MEFEGVPPSETPEPNLDRVSLGLGIALSAFAALMVVSLRAQSGFTAEQDSDPGRLMAWWLPLFGLGVVAIPIFIERRAAPLRSLGIRRPGLFDITWGVLAFALAVRAMATVAPLINRRFPAIHIQMNQLPMLKGWILVISAAVFEELFFRGYLIERLEMVAGSTWFAAGLSLMLFAFGHLPAWGPAGAVRYLVWGAFVTALYLLRRNLVVCMMMHLAQDALSIPVLWYAPLKRLFDAINL